MLSTRRERLMLGSSRLYKKASDSKKIGRLSPATPYIRSVRLFKNRTVFTEPRRPYICTEELPLYGCSRTSCECTWCRVRPVSRGNREDTIDAHTTTSPPTTLYHHSRLSINIATKPRPATRTRSVQYTIVRVVEVYKKESDSKKIGRFSPATQYISEIWYGTRRSVHSK
jgi:hypothetical protein